MRVPSSLPLALSCLSLLACGEPTDAPVCDARISPDPSGPPGVFEAALAYDAARERVVLFGGHHADGAGGFIDNAETWEWDGVAWSLRARTGPSPRTQARAAYDKARRVTILFGGHGIDCEGSVLGGARRLCGDTWAWDGSDWKKLASSGPRPRERHSMAYDASRERIVMYGGSPAADLDLASVWEWDGARWTARKPRACPGTAAAPRPRIAHGLVYHPALARVVLLGGSLDEAPVFDWDGACWSQWAQTSQATARSAFAAAYDEAARSLVLAGGESPSCKVGEARSCGGATDLPEGSTEWVQTSTETPSPRGSASMVYDSAREELVLFGGAANPCDCVARSCQETWTRKGRVWRQR